MKVIDEHATENGRDKVAVQAHTWRINDPVVIAAVFPRNKPDTFYARYFIRYVALLFVVLAGRLGISANAVSLASVPFAVASGLFLCMPDGSLRLLGALLLNFWLVLDCVDGSLARLKGSQPFGEYLDGISGYFAMTALLIGTGVGGAHELNWEPRAIAILICGFVGATANVMARLCYQKFTNVARTLGVATSDVKPRRGLLTTVDFNVGVGGIGALAIVPAVLLSKLYVLAIAYCVIYLASLLAFLAISVSRAYHRDGSS